MSPITQLSNSHVCKLKKIITRNRDVIKILGEGILRAQGPLCFCSSDAIIKENLLEKNPCARRIKKVHGDFLLLVLCDFWINMKKTSSINLFDWMCELEGLYQKSATRMNFFDWIVQHLWIEEEKKAYDFSKEELSFEKWKEKQKDPLYFEPRWLREQTGLFTTPNRFQEIIHRVGVNWCFFDPVFYSVFSIIKVDIEFVLNVAFCFNHLTQDELNDSNKGQEFFLVVDPSLYRLKSLSELEDKVRVLYVMDLQKKIYIYRLSSLKKDFNHASFLSHRTVLCAGTLWKRNLQVFIDNDSGHYKPVKKNLEAAQKIFKETFQEADFFIEKVVEPPGLKVKAPSEMDSLQQALTPWDFESLAIDLIKKGQIIEESIQSGLNPLFFEKDGLFKTEGDLEVDRELTLIKISECAYLFAQIFIRNQWPFQKRAFDLCLAISNLPLRYKVVLDLIKAKIVSEKDMFLHFCNDALLSLDERLSIQERVEFILEAFRAGLKFSQVFSGKFLEVVYDNVLRELLLNAKIEDLSFFRREDGIFYDKVIQFALELSSLDFVEALMVELLKQFPRDCLEIHLPYRVYNMQERCKVLSEIYSRCKAKQNGFSSA